MQLISKSFTWFVALICFPCGLQADPMLVAHRGLLRHAPENTLPAFAVCLELGIGFELDIRTSKDGQLIVLHDDNLTRTTNGPDCSVRELTLAEIKKLDAGSWFHAAFKGTRIPTLEQTFQLIQQRKTNKTIVALNIKQLNSKGEQELIRLIKKYNLFTDCFAFDQASEMSQRLKKLDSRIRIGQNVNRKQLDRQLRENFLDTFLLTFIPTRLEVEKLHTHHKQVIYNFAGTGKGRRNYDSWNKARATGLDGMLTDYPLECRRIWRKEKP